MPISLTTKNASDHLPYLDNEFPHPSNFSILNCTKSNHSQLLAINMKISDAAKSRVGHKILKYPN